MAVLNWLHLSDWHQHGKEFDRTVVRHALLSDIRARATINPELANLDFVFFTGDLAYHGLKEEYETAGAELLDPVLEAVGLKKERLFLIPGNHDLDQSLFDLLPDTLLEPFETEAQVQQWLGEERRRKRLLEPFEAYQNFVNDYGPAGFGAWGDLRIVSANHVNVGVLGCNAALMCGRNKNTNGVINDYGFLVVGEQQIYDPLNRLAEADVRIALIHHPFDWLAAFDRNKVERRLLRGCHFLLRGHVHAPAVQIVHGTAGEAVIVPGGACYNGRVPDRPLYTNAYNFVHYDTEAGQGTVYLRKWSDARDAWIADTDTGDNGQYSFSFSRPAAEPAFSHKVQTVNGTSSPASIAPIHRISGKIYLCCTPEDRKWLEEFKQYLTPLVQHVGLETWDETQIPVAAVIRDTINNALDAADSGVLLVTPAFLASDEINRNQLPRLLSKNVLWIAVEPALYELTPFAGIAPLNDARRPLSGLSSAARRQEWVNISRRILELLTNPTPPPGP